MGRVAELVGEWTVVDVPALPGSVRHSRYRLSSGEEIERELLVMDRVDIVVVASGAGGELLVEAKRHSATGLTHLALPSFRIASSDFATDTVVADCQRRLADLGLDPSSDVILFGPMIENPSFVAGHKQVVASLRVSGHPKVDTARMASPAALISCSERTLYGIDSLSALGIAACALWETAAVVDVQTLRNDLAEWAASVLPSEPRRGSEEVLYDGRIGRLVSLSEGPQTITCLERPDTILIAALSADDEVLFLDEFMAGAMSFPWGLPGGRVEGDAALEDEALRELVEETRLSGAVRRTRSALSSDYTTRKLHIALVTDLIAMEARKADEDHQLGMRWRSTEGLRDERFVADHLIASEFALLRLVL